MLNNEPPEIQQREMNEATISGNQHLARQRHIKPGLLKMALNLLETVREVAKAEGKLLISREEQEERFNICLECEELWLPEEGKGGARCCECGCFIQLKVPIRAADCPLKKWPAV